MTATIAADQVDYVDLYQRWEQGNWSAYEIDFSQDKIDWQTRFDEFMRKAAKWNYSLFFYGEDAVADNLSPFIDAAPLEEQKYFLTTQQVDEARHAVLFERFYREVIGVEGRTIGETLRSTYSDLTWGFRGVFEELDRVTDELRHDRSKTKLAQAVTLYHLVVEATLAQTGQHFITDYLRDMNVLPGFLAGMDNVALDEQRHIAFGVKLLADLNREDPEVKDAVSEVLGRISRYGVAVFYPPGGDERYVEVFGSSLVEVMAAGNRSLESKLKAAGLELFGPNGVIPYSEADRTPEERAESQLVLLKAGLLGNARVVSPMPSATLAVFFDLIRRATPPNAKVSKPRTVQWMFSDADPWNATFGRGETQISQSIAPNPDVTFRLSLQDWAGLSSGSRNPFQLLLSGRLRIAGSPRAIFEVAKVLRNI